MKKRRLIAIMVMAALLSWGACGKKSEEGGGAVDAGDVVAGDRMKLPLIAWGADIVTINANGKSALTTKGSPFEKAGLNFELFREDNFEKQVDMFIRGDIAFLRGTMGMVNMAMDRLGANPATRPVVVYQHSWSAGGDALVVKPGINSVQDLRGKSVAIQRNGPHVDYFLKLIKDARVGGGEVNIVWTKDLVGASGDTPMARLSRGGIDAAFVIIPDAMSLTSQGTVGSGAEDSVKGARILLSTKTANRIISDVYAVRKDYFDKNKDAVRRFVHVMLQSEEEVASLFAGKGDAWQQLLGIGGKLLLDDAGAKSDVEGMYKDAEMTGFDGNVKFFADAGWPRNYRRISAEIQDSLQALGLLRGRHDILAADWNYNDLRAGLRNAGKVDVSRFREDRTAVVAERMSKKGGSSLFNFEINFGPNQSVFTVSEYRGEFDRVIELASTYGGAIITVEGHSDPMNYLRKKKEGAAPMLLRKIEQAAKNLSYNRARAVRDEIVRYASSRGITLDPNQLNIIGQGIESPKYAIPTTKDQWRRNMRVEFKIMQVEAEEEVFRPL
ncbi:MAG: ABC transporter substrate-binding protein [Spirochaetes bacterium]|nr:ABC transporter substrate-binding protein [Spirochaetota bacterium]